MLRCALLRGARVARVHAARGRPPAVPDWRVGAVRCGGGLGRMRAPPPILLMLVVACMMSVIAGRSHSARLLSRWTTVPPAGHAGPREARLAPPGPRARASVLAAHLCQERIVSITESLAKSRRPHRAPFEARERLFSCEGIERLLEGWPDLEGRPAHTWSPGPWELAYLRRRRGSRLHRSSIARVATAGVRAAIVKSSSWMRDPRPAPEIRELPGARAPRVGRLSLEVWPALEHALDALAREEPLAERLEGRAVRARQLLRERSVIDAMRSWQRCAASIDRLALEARAERGEPREGTRALRKHVVASRWSSAARCASGPR